jgi:hypothetical protein
VRPLEINFEVFAEPLRRGPAGPNDAATGVLERAHKVETFDVRNRVLPERRCRPVSS